MSLYRSELIDLAVSWGNKRLAGWGLDDTVCIVYTARAARLLNTKGREMMVVDGDPLVSVTLLLARFEASIRSLLAPR